MAKKISSSDIFSEQDIFKGIRESAEKTISTMEALQNELKETAEGLKKSIGGAKFDSTTAIKNFTQETEKALKIQQQYEKSVKLSHQAEQQRQKALQESQKTQQQTNKTAESEIRLKQKQSQALEREQKQRERQKKLLKDEANAYKKLEKNTRELKNESKRLGAEMLSLEQAGKKNTAQYRKLANEYKNVTKQAQKGDAQLKKLDKRVGDNFRNVGNYKSALQGLNGMLGTLGLAFGVGSLVRTGVGAVVEFDQAIADLSAITGASGEDLKFYREQANKLGIEVEGGASAVVEAYKLIGSAKPELLSNAEALNELTEKAIILSQASGLDLPEASKRLTDAMNQFNAPVEDATRFIDSLANGAKFGSAEIPQITDALLKFGAVANSTNVSIEESTALIELLAEKGIKGSEAGTSLRNVMLKLSAPDALPKKAKDVIEGLGISFEKLKDSSIPFQEKLELLNPLLQDNANLVKVFGMENEVAGQILLENTERLGELNEQMKTQGTAQEQAEKRTNTLGHALMELKNSFIGLFTSINTGDGAMQNFIDGIKFIAKNLPTIISWIYKVARAWVIYRTSLLAIKGVQWIINGGFQQLTKTLLKQIPLTKAYRLEQIKTARAMEQTGKASKTAGAGVSAFGKAMKSIALIGIITIITEIATAWYDVASGTAEARRQKDMYDQAVKKGQKLSTDFLEKEKKAVDEKMRLLDLEMRKRKTNGETESKLDKERAQREVEIMQNAKNRVAQQQEDLEFAVRERKEQLKTFKQLEERAKRLPIGQSGQIITPQPVMKKALNEFKAALRDAAFEQGARTKVSMEVTEFFDYAKSRKEFIQNELTKEKEQLKGINGSIGEFNNYLDEAFVKLDETNYELNKGNQYVVNRAKHTAVISTEFDKQNRYVSEQVKLLQKIREIEQDREIDAKNKEISEEYKRQLDNIEKIGSFNATKLNDLTKERAELEKEAIKQRAQFEQDELEKQYDNESAQRRLQLELKYNELVKNANGNAKALLKIEMNYQKLSKQLDDDETLRYEDNKTKQKIIYEKMINDIANIDEELAEDINNNNEKLNKSLTDNNKKTADELAKQNKELIQDLNELVKLTTDFFIKQSEKKIAQIDKEIEKAEEQYNHFKQLAQQGNIDAEQSLAEQQKIIAEANAEKLRQEKIKARIELASSIYQTYASKLESNPTTALVDTIRDTTLLQQFINSLPAFEKGTEDTGKNGRGVDGKGGFNAILHPNERVIPKTLNDQIKGISNEDLIKIATQYKINKSIGNSTDAQLMNALDFSIVASKLDELKDTIKNKPETND
jgi:TP901 family phage tail tape measure protein